MESTRLLERSRWVEAFDAVHLLRAEVFLLTLIPGRLVFGPLGGVGSPALLLGVFLLGVWVLTLATPGLDVARRSRPLRVVLGLWWMVLLVGYAVMNNHPVKVDELANSDRFLISMAAFTGVALTAAEGLRNRDELMAVVRALVLGGGFMSFVAILQFHPGLDLTEWLAKLPLFSPNGSLVSIQARGGFTRPPGTALHPIEFGVVAGLALAFAIHLAIYDLDQSRVRRFVPAALIALAIPISISRSALLVSSVVLVYFFVGTTRALRRRGLVLFAFFAVIIFMTIPGLLGTLKGFVFLGSNDSSIASRTSDFAAVASYLSDSPWIGRGPGSFLPARRLLDNQYLMTLVESGIAGLVMLVSLLGLPAALGRASRRRSTTDADRSLGQAFAAAGIAMLAAAFTFDALSFPTFTGTAAVLVGLCAAWWAMRNADEAEVPIRKAELSTLGA